MQEFTASRNLVNMISVLKHIITPFILLAQTLYCWYCFYQAQFLQYDDDINLLLHALMIAILTPVVIMLLRKFKVQWSSMNIRLWALWMVVGSPLTFIVVGIYYSDIFGGVQ